MNHFLDIHTTSAADLRVMINSAHAMKQARNNRPKGTPDDDQPLAGRMVALSGAGNPPAGQREALMKAGFDACLARPVDAQQCRAALQGRSSC